MHTRRSIHAVLIALLAVAGLGGGIAACAAPGPEQGPAAQTTAPAAIEPALQVALQSEGQADLFVMFRDQVELSPAYGMSWEARGEYVVRALAEVAQRSQAEVRASLDAQRIPYESFIINNSIYIPNATPALADSLAGAREVSALRLERLLPLPEPVAAEGEGPAPEYTVDWGLTDSKATDVWALGTQGSGIKVANIDTGVEYTHPALDQAYACASDPSNAKCWKDPYGTYTTPADANGHGTHTMGTMVGDDDSSLTYWVGMAPDATWIACRGCSTSSCTESALTACADWILAPGGDSANRPHIVNNSWGGLGGRNWYLSYVTAWRAAGIFPAFSAGNSGSSCSTLGSPGDYQESFATAAHDSGRTIASFSSRGPSAFGHDPYTKPNISAPGVSICSSVPGSNWNCTYSGTSMASPHTAGAVALIWSACPSLVGNVDGTFQLLQNNADAAPAGTCNAPPDGQGNYTYGYGYLNVLAAVDACSGIPTPTPGPSPTPTHTPTPAPAQPILLVDDDANASYQSYFTAALDSLGRTYDTWTVHSQGSPSAATLQAHQVVIWLTGGDFGTTLTGTDVTNLAAYLDGGGKLFITGQDIGYDINTDAFFGSYLHASYIADDTNVTTLTGTDIMAGADVTISGGDGANNQTYPSAIGLGTGAVGLYGYDGTTDQWGALRWEGAYRVVYFAFGFEGISAAASCATVMSNVLAWLEGAPLPPSPTPTFTPSPAPSGGVILPSANATHPTVGTANEEVAALEPGTGTCS